MSPSQEGADSPAIISPLGDVPPPIGTGKGPMKMHALLSLKSPPFPPTPSRGISSSSSLSSTPPNTTSSNQSSPFHYAEFQNDVGSLQRRLSQERRRRSSAQSISRPFERSGSISAEEPEIRNQVRADTSETSASEICSAQEQAKLEEGWILDKVALTDAEQSGMDHLRGARQELQAVIEEVVGDVLAARSAWEPTGKMIHVDADQTASSDAEEGNTLEDGPTQLGLRDDIHQSANTESALGSTPASPSMARATEAQKTSPLTFEDLVRHRRNSSSASNQFPQVNTSRSGPASPTPYSGRSRVGSTADGFMDSLASRTKQVYANHPSPSATRDDHLSPDANQLTMMRRTFSGESRSASPDQPPSKVDTGDGRVIAQDMMFREPLAPESILRSSNGADCGHAQDANETKPTEIGTPMQELDSAMSDIELAERSDSMESYRPTTCLAALSAEKQYRSRSNSRSGPDMPSRDASPEAHPHDTHLWDSVWPSAATRVTHPAASGHMPYPKPISETRNTLTPRLPMHSRTMSMGMGGISGSGPSSGFRPATHAHIHPTPMIHSLSFPTANQQSPPPFTSHTSGVPLSFSVAMSQTSAPCPWPQHPSARRGSIASLGVWPLKRDVSSGGAVDKSNTIDGQGDAANPERKQTIMEESDGGEDDKGAEVLAGRASAGETNGASAIDVAEPVQDSTIG